MGQKKFFLENLALSCTTSYGFLAPFQNLEKTNDTIPRKCLHRRTEGQKGGQTLFHRALPATAGGPITILGFTAATTMHKKNQLLKLLPNVQPFLLGPQDYQKVL